MLRTFVTLAAALLSTAASAQPVPPDDTICVSRATIEQPEWVRPPSVDVLWGYYPHAVLRLKMSARVVVVCNANARGGLYNCAVVEEQPAGHSFGDGALQMVHRATIRPPTLNGQPVVGAIVRVPIQFAYPESPKVTGPAVSTPIPQTVLTAAPCLATAPYDADR